MPSPFDIISSHLGTPSSYLFSELVSKHVFWSHGSRRDGAPASSRASLASFTKLLLWAASYREVSLSVKAPCVARTLCVVKPTGAPQSATHHPFPTLTGSSELLGHIIHLALSLGCAPEGLCFRIAALPWNPRALCSRLTVPQFISKGHVGASPG